MGLEVVLAGLEKGGQPLAGLAFCASILNKLFPNCVSTVLGGTLSEAEPRGLEGPAPGKGVLFPAGKSTKKGAIA